MHSNRKNEIIYFDERSHGNSFFHLSMAGRTLPNPNYIICHSRKSGALWERYNFEYVISGKGYIETRDKTLTVGKGDLYFLNKLQQHTYYADKQAPYEKLFIVVEGSLADKMLEAHGVTESALVVHADARALFEQIIALSDRHEGQFIDAEAYTEISSILLKLIQLVKPPDFNTTAMDEHPATIIKNYIDYNIYDKITLAEIADTVHLSVSRRGFSKPNTAFRPSDTCSTKSWKSPSISLSPPISTSRRYPSGWLFPISNIFPACLRRNSVSLPPDT